MNKFSVIITHYNQMSFIKESIMSVLNQDYNNIELIVADDGSPTFDRKKVEKIIKKYNKKKFEYKILDSKKNVGTVKNLNSAVKATTGDFVLFFAADDKLFDSKVISNFEKAFRDEKTNIITSQCLLYDYKLEKIYSKYVNPIKAYFLNKKSSKHLYYKMACGCFYGSGGTAYRKSVFKKYGIFDENYLFVEDWSYWLKILREGEKIYYYNFKSLCHRDGGISHSEYSLDYLPPHIRRYYTDILNIYINEIFNYFDMFSFYEKYKILVQYQQTTLYYSSFAPELFKYLDVFKKYKNESKKMSLFWKITLIYRNFLKFIIYRLKVIFHFNKIVTSTFIIWLLLSLLLTSMLKINNNLLLLIYIFLYFIVYSIVGFMVNTIKFIRNRNTGGLYVQ